MPRVQRVLRSGEPIPELMAGDRLDRDEFERRYRAMPRLKKAELIGGVVYVASPVRMGAHSLPHADLIGWLVAYRAATPGVAVAGNPTVRLEQQSELQPDAALVVDPSAGGQSRISADDYVEGAPELVAEVAASSASYDLHDKLEAYRRSGVREYLVWRTLDEAFDWYLLVEGRYEPLQPAADGTLRSAAFPGLWLDPAALLRGDLATVLELLQRGIATPEHGAFAERLRAALGG